MEKLIETRNLIIRKFREEDAEPLYENHRDEEVKKWFPNECYKDPEEAQGAIQFYVDCVDNGHLPFVQRKTRSSYSSVTSSLRILSPRGPCTV